MGAGSMPELYIYRLSLNQPSIRVGCRQERRGRKRGRKRENPKQPQAAANHGNAPEAKTVNKRLKDNAGQISEHQYSAQGGSLIKMRLGGGRGVCSPFVLTKVRDRLPVINEAAICGVFKMRRRIQCHNELI